MALEGVSATRGRRSLRHAGRAQRGVHRRAALRVWRHRRARLDAWHLLRVWRRRAGPALAGYLRVLLPGHPDESDTDIRIGRVLTTAGFRGIGLGNAMLEHALETHRCAVARMPDPTACAGASAMFYGAFGFEPISEIHDEDGIPHVWMRSASESPCASVRDQSARAGAGNAVDGAAAGDCSPAIVSRLSLAHSRHASKAASSDATRSARRSRSSSIPESIAAVRRSADRASG